MSTEILTTIVIWAGASVGFLKVVDWTLSSQQKKWMTDRAETAWIWLHDQNAGKFVSVMHMRRAQVIFVLIAHAWIIFTVLGHLSSEIWSLGNGYSLKFHLSVGHPRLYRNQVWVDVFALVISAAILSATVHVRIATWIAEARTLWHYFGRCAMVLGAGMLLTFAYLISMQLIVGFDSPAFESIGPDGKVAAYELMLGGGPGVIAVHAISAVVAAPILAEMLIVQMILFLSFWWLVTIWSVIAAFRALQFILIRVAESSDGPVMAFSGLLIGVGTLAKAFTG